MSESVEKMVAQLITMVGKVLESQNDMKTDITGMKTEMAEMKSDLRAEMTEMKSDLRAEMTEMKAELKAEIAQVKNKVDDINGKLTYLVADVELLEHDNFQNKKEINRIKKHLEV